MLTPQENKSGARRCSCGRPTGERSCRPVRDGWWCVQRGLTYDPRALIHSEPDPQLAAVRDDVQVRAALAVEQAAQDAYAEVEHNWIEAHRRHSRAQLGAGMGGWTVNFSAWRSRPEAKLAAKELPKTAEALGAATIARDRAAADLAAAKAATRRAVQAARLANGLGVYEGEIRASHSLTIAA